MAFAPVSLAPLLLGFALGLRHALDPDHLAAMGTIVAREPAPGRAAMLGIAWGLGHSASLLGASLVIVALRLPVPERVGALLELAVAAMLILLGIQSLRRGFDPAPKAQPASARRPLLIGLVHGLAGSGGLALLVLPGLSSPATALVYVALFGIGSIGGMALWSAALAWPVGRLAGRGDGVGTWIPRLSGVASVIVGVVVVTHVA